VNCGEVPIKRVVGDPVDVTADIYADGHEAIRCVLRYRAASESHWHEVPMAALGNDTFAARFTPAHMESYYYSVSGWVDHFETWRNGMVKKIDANVDTPVDFAIGAGLLREAEERASGDDAKRIEQFADTLLDEEVPKRAQRDAALSEELEELMRRYPDRRFETRYPQELEVRPDRERAAFSAWYEMFPRSTSQVPGKHGTFRDCIERLPYIAELGFDVLYLPPIHPIGETKRKGRNNALDARTGDPGSPWAIGSKQGGHKAIHPELGTLEDFHALIAAARRYGIEIALDIAFQCSPDHPYVREHPEWFSQRPDGSIQFAENPPKKYEDIYPINFESEHWEEIWEELVSVFEYWIEQGVSIFRVDNPHTKSLYFWEWALERLRSRHPQAIFLSEAFTRPKRMYRLAKIGFTQSYTYFTWRNSPATLREYLTELTQSEVAEFFRPNFWPNTPDILHEELQHGGRPAFIVRFVLAATLSANYGVYGPPFELMEHTPREPGSEEYLNSEKYEIRYWDLERPDSLRGLIARMNAIRRANPALQRQRELRFHATSNERLLCYSKRTEDGENVICVVVNMDYVHSQAGHVEFSPAAVEIPHFTPFVVRDLLADHAYTWTEYWNFVELDPRVTPVHVFRLEQPQSRDRDR
jgi:starch synthase (maltosyl-transferring)